MKAKDLGKAAKSTAPTPSIPVTAPYRPVTVVRVTKAQAAQISVGERVSISVSGDVQGVQKAYDSELYEVTLAEQVADSITGNHADNELRKMTRTITKQIAKNPADNAWDDVRK